MCSTSVTSLAKDVSTVKREGSRHPARAMSNVATYLGKHHEAKREREEPRSRLKQIEANEATSKYVEV